MRRLATASTIAFMVFLLFSSLLVDAEEQKPKYPPLDELIDITDKVTITEAKDMKFDTWHFDKETPPPLPNAAKVCKAKEGWDSYPDGAKMPLKNFGLRDGLFPHSLIESTLGKKLNMANIDVDKWCSYSSLRLFEMRNPKSLFFAELDDKPEILHFDRDESVLKRCQEFLRNIPFNRSYAYNLMVLMTSNDEYIHFEWYQPVKGNVIPPYCHPINKTFLGSFSDGKLKIEESDRFKNHEFITCWARPTNCRVADKQTFDKILLFNTKVKAFELYGDDLKLIKTVPMFQKKYKKTNIWHAPRIMAPRTYPLVLIYEDNWGFERARQIKDFQTDGGMNQSFFGYFIYDDFMKSEIPVRRTIVFNVETGKIEWEISGVYSVDLLNQGLMRIPNTARNGQLGLSLVKKGTELAFLPYSSVLPKSFTHFLDASSQRITHWDFSCDWAPKAFCDSILGRDNISVVDYSEMTVKKPNLQAKLDNSFPSIIDEAGSRNFYKADIFVLTTKEYSKEGKAYRDFVLITGKDTESPFKFLRTISIPTEKLGKIKGDCFAWVTVRGLEIYINGKVFLVKGVVN